MAATTEEKITSIIETTKHINHVRQFIRKVISAVEARGIVHDFSKLEEPELTMFAQWGPRLKGLQYGTDEYKAALDEMGEGLEHHYRVNRHHPEAHEEGVAGMDLVDLIEMACDWAAAGKRMRRGNWVESVEINKERFDLDPQLVSILKNSDHLLGGSD